MTARHRSLYRLSRNSINALANLATHGKAPPEVFTLMLSQADDSNLFYPTFGGERVRGYDALRIDVGAHAGKFVLRGPISSQKPQSAQSVLLHIFTKVLADPNHNKKLIS